MCTFPTYQCLGKEGQDFLFCIDPELLINLVSVNVLKSGLFILANNSRSKQNEINLEHPFEHIGKKKTYEKF